MFFFKIFILFRLPFVWSPYFLFTSSPFWKSFSCTSKQIYINYKVLKAYLRPSSIPNPPLPRGSCGGITPFTSLTYIQFSIIITFFYRIDICDNAAAAQLSGSLLRPNFFHHVSCCRRKHNQQVQKTWGCKTMCEGRGRSYRCSWNLKSLRLEISNLLANMNKTLW